MATSAIVHASVAGIVWQWGPERDIYLLKPQAGRASIALTASIEAKSAPAPPEVRFLAPSQQAPTPIDALENVEQTDSAVASDDFARVDDSPAVATSPESLLASIEVVEIPFPATYPAERQRESDAVMTPVAEATSAPTVTPRHFAAEPALPSMASLPSPASMAAAGVETQEPPQVVLNPPPVYPAEALAAGKTGRVIVRAQVAADGRVVAARVQRSSGVASLDAAAVTAVRTWRFSSAAHAATALRPVNVPIDFVIRRR